MRLPTTLVVTALVAGALAPAAGAVPRSETGSKGLGIRLLDAPTALKDDPRARIYVIDHLQPGSSITRRVSVTNSTDALLTASLYVGGASVEGGQFRPADRGVPSDVSDWSTITPTSAQLPKGASQTATFRLTVPKDATDGERYGVIWAELPPSGGAVKSVNRVGIRVYLSIGDGSAPDYDFTIQLLQAERRSDGVPQVTASVKNTGQRALDISGSLKLSEGPGGLSAGPFNATLGTTLGIGDTEPVAVVLPTAITGGPWKAELTLRSGEKHHTVAAQLTFPERGSAAPVTPVEEKDDGHDGRSPLLTAVAAALVLLVLAMLLLLRRRRRDPES